MSFGDALPDFRSKTDRIAFMLFLNSLLEFVLIINGISFDNHFIKSLC
jgi:hypothetical protein